MSNKYDPLNRLTNMVDAAGTAKYTYAAGGQLYTEDGPFACDVVTNTYNNRLRVSLAAANTYRFSSEELHVNSGLYYYGFRWYDPNSQRWPNRNPIQEAGEINLYAYAGNDSVNLIDPFGQQFAPTGPIFPESPISGDANKCQTGTSTTGNAPVANPKPAAPLPLCFNAGAIQKMAPPYSKGSCPGSGEEIRCFDYEKCELADVAQGLKKTITALVWVKHTKCSTCPEYSCR